MTRAFSHHRVTPGEARKASLGKGGPGSGGGCGFPSPRAPSSRSAGNDTSLFPPSCHPRRGCKASLGKGVQEAVGVVVSLPLARLRRARPGMTRAFSHHRVTPGEARKASLGKGVQEAMGVVVSLFLARLRRARPGMTRAFSHHRVTPGEARKASLGKGVQEAVGVVVSLPLARLRRARPGMTRAYSSLLTSASSSCP